MAFTYDPTLADDVSQVRFFIGDTVENSGPRPTTSSSPTTSNYQDSEITAILASVGNDVNQTVAIFLDLLATEWSKLATSVTMGPYKEELWRVSSRYQDQAKQWRDNAGLTYKTFSSGVIRRAGISDSRFIT